jgi:hypothetical protein
MDSLIVPSSIQRIRAFLVELCGMKVKPWATAEETLAALHATLVRRQSCDMFWSSLRVLLETLARDLKARESATPGSLLDNEILSSEQYATLLDEIRACMARQSSEVVPSFRRLAQGLSAPALGLLLLLGGVTTVACEGSSLRGSGLPDAAVTDTRPGQPDSPPDAKPDTAPDSKLYITLPDQALAKDDVPPVARDVKEAASTGPDGAKVTLQDIMDSCNLPSRTQGGVLACLSSLGESWTAGLADYLAGKDCFTVATALTCDGFTCSRFLAPGDFDPQQLPLCMPIYIYVGVRFV